MLAIVRELGAVAGVAAALGLVVLSALYVAHGRDVKRLREWAGRAPEGLGPPRAAPARTAGVSEPAPHTPSTQRSVPVLVGLLIAGGLVTYSVSQLAGSDGGDHSAKTKAHDDGSSRRPKRSGVAVKPGAVTVAVLNGTTVNGLAAALREQITAAGFRRGTIDVFSDQQLGVSVVEYAPGHLAAAKAVGRIVGINRYEAVAATSRALAADATVIVVAGADKAP